MNRNYQEKINQVCSVIKNSEQVIIGGGAGLSASAGLVYSGERFENNFQEFIAKYDIPDMYSAGFYPFETQEEKWAYWSKHIQLNRFDVVKNTLYSDLYNLVKEKDCYVITTNVDYQFYKDGFGRNQVFAVQGDYGKLQCSIPCHQKLYDNEELITEMVLQQNDCRIPTNLIPKCSVCGHDMEVNIRKDNTFVEDEYWHESYERYKAFVGHMSEKRTVLLELGVGYNTPTIIKYPFQSLLATYDNASLIRINKQDPELGLLDADRAIPFEEDVATVVNDILKA